MAEDEAQAIARRMAALRRELTGDVREVSRKARVMTDWTFYVRRFPWVTAGLATAAGFMLIPKKKAVISPDQDALAEMVRKKQLRLDVDHKSEKPSLFSTLLMMVATGAAKTAMGYLGERMKNVAALKAQHSSPTDAPSASIH
jgi:hypothetical protein